MTRLASATLALVALAALALTAHAREAGTAPTNPDAWCVHGGAGRASSGLITQDETCIDYSGNLTPTTNATQALGTSSTQWSNVETAALNSGAGSLAVGGQLGLYSRTVAQAQVLVPAAAGAVIYCSDCSPKKVLVATGTSAGNWADAVGGTFK